MSRARTYIMFCCNRLPEHHPDSTTYRLADKQAKPCLLACLLVLAGSKQASKRPYFGQSSKQKEGLLACLLACLLLVYS